MHSQDSDTFYLRKTISRGQETFSVSTAKDLDTCHEIVPTGMATLKEERRSHVGEEVTGVEDEVDEADEEHQERLAR